MGFSCEKVREDFPELSRRKVVYLDSTASSLKPRRVIEAMAEFMSYSYANVHRGVYTLSLEASRAYDEAHEVVARFIGARDWREVVFTKSTTEAMQLLAQTFIHNRIVKQGDEVILTEAEHNSTLLPWYRAAKSAGARVKLVPVDEEGVPRWSLLESMVSEKTRAVVFAHVSNVTGYVSDVRRIARIAHSVGAYVVVDGAQSVPHLKTRVYELEADFLAFSGHKMLGPTGIGVLWGRLDILEDLENPLGGGDTVKNVTLAGEDLIIEWEDLPMRFEAGTPPIVEAVGLAEAVRYLESLGMESVEEHDRELTRLALRELEEIEEVKIVGPRDPQKKTSIVAFNVGSVAPDLVGLWLDSMGIAVRTGRHCAHVLHQRLGLPLGSVRASFYVYNCREDVYALSEALRKLSATIK
ncbi:MAG: cysteine desulfurase [Acidilobaceae archaeon]